MFYLTNDKLNKLIYNQRVAIIGPSGYLMNKNLGSFINSFDTICRSNYFAAKGLEHDYGNRTDIMFYNCCYISLSKMKKHIHNSYDVAQQIKLVVCPVVKSLAQDKWQEWDDNYIAPVTKNFQTIDPLGLDFCWIGIKNYKLLINEIGYKEPNSGIMSISMILKHKPKELFISGFSFYNQKVPIYFDNYPMAVPGQTGAGHNQNKQLHYLKTEILKQKNIIIDSCLKKILNIEYNNIIEV